MGRVSKHLKKNSKAALQCLEETSQATLIWPIYAIRLQSMLKTLVAWMTQA